MADKGEMTNQIKAMIFGNRAPGPGQADLKPKKPRTIAYDRHSLVEIGKNTASHTRPSFLDVEYDNISRVDGSKRWDPERWHAGTKAQHLKARREAAAKEMSAKANNASSNSSVIGEPNSWRKSKSDKRSGLAMDEEVENGKNDETFGVSTRLGPQRRSYKEGCKPGNTRDEGPKGDQGSLSSSGASWRDSRKKEPWRRGGDDDKFSDFRNDDGGRDGGNKYGNNNARSGYNDRNNRYNNNRGGNRYGRGDRFGRDSPDEEPEWMNPDDGTEANEMTFMALEGLPGDMRGKETSQGRDKNRDSPELVAFDESAFMGTTDDGGETKLGGALGAALGELGDPLEGELGGALEDDPQMDGLIKSSFMDIMKDDDTDSAPGASKFSAFFDSPAEPELNLPSNKHATAGFPPPQNIGVPAGLIPPNAAGLGLKSQPQPPLGMNLWNIQQAGSGASHPTPEQQMKQQSAQNRVNDVFSQFKNPQVSSIMPLRPPGVAPMPAARNWDILPGTKNEPPRPQQPPAGLPASLFGFGNGPSNPPQQQQRAGPPMPPRGFPMTAMSVEDLEGPRRNISPNNDNQPAPDVKRKLMNLRNEFDQKSNVQRMMFLGAQQPPGQAPQGLLQHAMPQRMQHQMQHQAPRAHHHMQQQHQKQMMDQRDVRAAQEQQRIRVAQYLASEEKNRTLTPTEATFMKQFRAEQNGLYGPGPRTMIDQNLNQLNLGRDNRDHSRSSQNLDFNRQKESFEEKLRQQSSIGSSGPPHPEQVPKFNQFTPTSVMRKMVHRKGDEPGDGRPHRNPKITPLEHTGVVRVPKGANERKLSNGGVSGNKGTAQGAMRNMTNAPPVIYTQQQQQRSVPPPVINSSAPNSSSSTQMLFHQRGLIPSQIRAPASQQASSGNNEDNTMIHRLLQQQPQANRAFPEFG